MSSPEEVNRYNVWRAKVMLGMAWTTVCGFLWLLQVFHLGQMGNDTKADPAAVGLGVVILTGCSGGVWVFGVLVILLIAALFRR